MLRSGHEFELTDYEPAKSNHLKVSFAKEEFGGTNTLFVFRSHVQIFEDGKQVVPSPATQEILLDVPFLAQLARPEEPTSMTQWEQNRTCNTSSNAMVAKYLGAEISGDDEYYKFVQRYGDTTDHGAQTKALEAIEIQSTWHTNLSFVDLDRSLSSGLPVVIGILHRGSAANPTGGHMLVVIGRRPNGDYIVNDPFGSLVDSGGAYTGAVNNGRRAVYSRGVLTARWLVSSDPTARSGWGRLFYGNR